MALKKLKAPESLKIDFCPSPKQYELWKLLLSEYPLCDDKVDNKESYRNFPDSFPI